MIRISQLIKHEFSLIFKDKGAVLILIGALIIYSLLYGTIYQPEVVRDIPIAVIDLDQSAESRELVRRVNATPQAHVAFEVNSLDQAKQLFLERKVSGVLHIPKDYEAKILRQQQSYVSIYADGSYFLLYNNFFSAIANVALNQSVEVKTHNLINNGVEPDMAQNIAQPLKSKVSMLYNPYLGYAAALLPAVLILILQQVILIGIGLIMGTHSEFKQWYLYRNFPTRTIVFVKSLCYCTLYIPLAFYLLWINYEIFGYPFKGIQLQQAMLLVPYICSSIFAAIAFGGLLRRRESSIVYLASFSILLLMMSGISWPKEGMPLWFYYVGKIFPSSSAIEAWTAMRSAGATIYNVMPEWITLWGLTAFYGILALISVRFARKRESRPNNL